MIPFYLTDKGILVTVLAQTGKFLYSAAFAVVYVFTAELFPSTVRNSGLSACATLGKTATVISPYIVHLVSVHILLACKYPPCKVLVESAGWFIFFG